MRFLFLSGILLLSSAASASLSPQLLNAELGLQSPNRLESIYEAVREVCAAADEFSGKLVQEVAKRDQKNFIVSPFSAALGVSMLSIGAEGSSETELLNVIPFRGNKVKRLRMFHVITTMLNSYRAVGLNVVNGLFVSSLFGADPRLTQYIKKCPRSLVQNVDFSESQETSSLINEWFENETDGRIKSVVDASKLNRNMALILINALSFKARWLEPFETMFSERAFMLGNGTKQNMSTLLQRNFFLSGYLEEMDAKFVELPYVSEKVHNNKVHNISMFIILPNGANGFANLDKNIDKLSIRRLLERRRKMSLEVIMPKFRIESNILLNQPLKEMGLETLFNASSANLSGLLNYYSAKARSTSPSLDRIEQKAFIGVDDIGTEAAAVTSMYYADRSSFERFVVDRPFYAVVATTGEFPLNLLTARFTGLE